MSNTLDGHVPDLEGVPRDAGGIICQLESTGRLDGGDSAHRAGVAAFCNSAADTALLPRFESGGLMVRHPIQPPWNDWRNCSRDQLKGYTAGCWRAGRIDINERLLHATAARSFTCQNTQEDEPGKPSKIKNPPVGDVLLPDDVMCLRITAGENLAFMDLAGQLSLHIAIETASRDAKTDKNNLMLESIICGRLNLFAKVHSNYEDFLHYYWADQRGQARIAEELIWVVKQELKRYPTLEVPLLPANLLNVLRDINLGAELKNLDPEHHTQLVARFLEAGLRDAANTFVFSMKLGVDGAVNEFKKLRAGVDQIAKALANIDQTPNAIRAGLVAGGFPASFIAPAMQGAFPGIPHVDTFVAPHADVVAIPHTDVAPVHQDVGAVHADVRTLHTDQTGPHADRSGPFGTHLDVGGPHADVGGIHTDMLTTPHVDVKVSPHVDAGPTAHVDTPSVGHVDTP
ncbi:hypothetical protein [Bradyrhizobium quebecense]|uniref:Uncharacterized protein n=2 Tax=Bradyrhizobium quebecense TaxID=2748629 RepID=A0ABS3MTJ6_9BRAD|nr:hypothetical protein [Bradyrhizobium quebecense]UGY02534.1 hypothetical protein J4P68_0036550 [Bradyrhizobium quebecense]